jgi:hypothetical protein
MSALRKLVGQTAIYGLSIVLLLSACSVDHEKAIIGTWKTTTPDGTTGMVQFDEHRRLRTWAEPRPPEGSNLGRAMYHFAGDTLGLVGELHDTVLYSMHWVDQDHVTLIGIDRSFVLTRASK